MNRNLLHGLSWLAGFMMANLIWFVANDDPPKVVVPAAFALLCVCVMFVILKHVEIQKQQEGT